MAPKLMCVCACVCVSVREKESQSWSSWAAFSAFSQTPFLVRGSSSWCSCFAYVSSSSPFLRERGREKGRGRGTAFALFSVFFSYILFFAHFSMIAEAKTKKRRMTNKHSSL